MMMAARRKGTSGGSSTKKHRQRPHHFLAAWLRSPLKMGAVVPSSRGLAMAMTRPLDFALPGMVIELGAGTGVMTHALLDAGLAPERLVVIERDPHLHTLLAAHFPDIKIICADARHLSDVLAARNITDINAIVSSLPLLSMPKAIRDAIEECLAGLLEKGGILVQFTYGPGSPIRARSLRKHRLVGKRVKTVLNNVPPAHVWVYRRSDEK